MINKFTEVHDSSEKPLLQIDGVKVQLADHRVIYADKAYLNKLFKDSGYKGCFVVDSVYEIVGDTTAMDNLDIGDNLIVVDDDSNFIYLSRTAYNSVKAIEEYIESKYVVNYRYGDLKDFKKYADVFYAGTTEYVIEIDLVSEWVILYTARHKSDGRLHPSVLVNMSLNDDTVVGTVIDCIQEDASVIDSLDYSDRDLKVADMIYILEATGLIKYNGRKKAYVSKTEDPEVLNKLVDYLEVINSCKWRYRYTTSTGTTYGGLMEYVNLWYGMVVDTIAEIPFDISKFLWRISKVAGVIED